MGGFVLVSGGKTDPPGLLFRLLAARNHCQVPPELENAVDSMVEQHLDLYDWGTSAPIYSRLVSGFVQPTSLRGRNFVGSNRTPDVGGIFDRLALDQRLLTEINCGEGSYLERVSDLVSPSRSFGRASCLSRSTGPYIYIYII